MVDVAQLLATLRPMREPPPPSPILPFLVMLASGGALALVLAIAVRRIRARRGDLRRAAQAALAGSRSLAPAERLAAQALLLRRIVRTRLGDADARKQGHDWLESLDHAFATSFFTQGPGTAYADALYRPVTTVDVDALDRSLCGLLDKVHA